MHICISINTDNYINPNLQYLLIYNASPHVYMEKTPHTEIRIIENNDNQHLVRA